MKTFFQQQKPYFNSERLISHFSDIGAIGVIVGWIYVCMKQQKWLSEHVFVETTRRWSSFPEQTLPATCESKAPWGTRVQDKENKPQCTLLIELAALLVTKKCLITYCPYNPRDLGLTMTLEKRWGGRGGERIDTALQRGSWGRFELGRILNRL